MGNKAFNPCPSDLTLQKQYKSEIMVVTIKQFQQKHSLLIEGPSEIYKKSLRKDMNTAELADQVMIDWDLDKCFKDYKEDTDSMVLTKATQGSINKRNQSFLQSKIQAKSKEPSKIKLKK